MPGRDLDVVAVGNAIVDVLAHAADDKLRQLDLVKGSMTLVDSAVAATVYSAMGPGTEVSGGGAANTAVGVASFGGRASFIGKTAGDQLGQVFAHDITAAGVGFAVDPAPDGETGRCLVLVTPDAQRTMATFLGVAGSITPEDIDLDLVAAAQVFYVEGYLWDQPPAKEAIRTAIAHARRSGTKVAFTLSDSFCVDRHRAEFLGLLDDIDVLFANETEAVALFQADGIDTAVSALGGRCEVAAVTRSEKGSVVVTSDAVHEIGIERLGDVVDTTGAGDLYAAGFLFGLTHGRDLADCGRLGSLAAAEVISHLGARPDRSLGDLARERSLVV